MNQPIKNTYGVKYFNYLKNRGLARSAIRKVYLKNIKKYCLGTTIDFGCGVGRLLQILPAGSIGFEVNKAAIDYCKLRGLNVEYYDPDLDDYEFRAVPHNRFDCFTMNHVLEHIDNAHLVIKKIFASCYRLGIQRIVFTVPGYRCFYRHDETHRTFIDEEYLEKNGVFQNEYYKLKLSKYFPFNWRGIDHYFTHNELRLVFDKK